MIKKWRFSGECEPLSTFFGIEIIDKETGAVLRPTYPFSTNKSPEMIQEFIELYEKELLDFYVTEYAYSFGTFVHPDIENDTKDVFRQSWFKRGVVFY